jgi:hypothetical protein
MAIRARTRIAVLLIFTLMMQAWLPFLPSFTSPSVSEAKIALCTKFGVQWVALDALTPHDASQPQDSSEHTASYACGLCYLAAQGLDTIQHTLPFAYAAPLQDSSHVPLDAYLTPNASYALQPYDSRAPPVC